MEIDPSGPVLELCARGLLLSDEEPELRRRDERLTAEHWHPAAALYHFSTRLRGANLDLPEDEHEEFAELASEADRAAARFVERHGPPPPHFHSVGREKVVLPLVGQEGDLYDTLAARRTTRGFDRVRSLALEQLAVLLYEVFGCRGYARIHEDVIVLRKSSPSGGGLHPLEAYPLVRAVEGIEPGLYHYRAEDHSLELLEALDEAKARSLLASFTCGQVYLASAAVAIVITARFGRSFWKYRRQGKAYATLLMDAGHLSQSFYLVCAQLGLGAYVTDVINGADIEERLGVDGMMEGALAVCGCGPRASVRSRLDPDFIPYVPGETTI